MIRTISSNGPKTVGTGYTDLVETSLTEDFSTQMSVKLTNTGANALTDLKVQRQFSQNGDWEDYVGGADFTAPYTPAVAMVSNVSPATLGVGSSSWFDLSTFAAYAVKIQAKVASGSTFVTVDGGFSKA